MSTCRLVQPSLWHELRVALIGVANKAYLWQEQRVAIMEATAALWIEVNHLSRSLELKFTLGVTLPT